MDMISKARLVRHGDIARLATVVRTGAAHMAAQTADWDAAETITVAADVDGATHYVAAWSDVYPMTAVPRPEHSPPAGAVAVGAALGGFPAGFSAWVVAPNGQGQAITLPASGELSFDTAGLWRVEVGDGWEMDSPRPERRAVFEIEVA